MSNKLLETRRRYDEFQEKFNYRASVLTLAPVASATIAHAAVGDIVDKGTG